MTKSIRGFFNNQGDVTKINEPIWRSGVRSAMRAASQLSGRGPTNVDVAPVPVC